MDTLFRIAVIAQQGLIETWYSRTYSLLSIVILVCTAISLFAGELVLTGSDDTRLVIYNFALRIILAATIAIYTIQKLVREKTDKQMEYLLALDMPRELYLLGNVVGLMAVLGFAVILASIYPIWFINIEVVIIWAMSLMAELGIVVCLSIFVATSLTNTAACFSIVMGVYFLARNMGNLLLLSQSPILQGQEIVLEWAKPVLEGINLLLPDLWRYAQSEWLAGDEIISGTLSTNILSSLVFCLLLITASAFDLHRKNL